jgi:hypothetical protein
MSDESGQKDPSMEEILGSIRKIISEDNSEGAPAGQPAEGDDEDILELTEEVSGEADEERVEPVLASAADEPAPEEPRKEPVFGAKPADSTGDAAPPEATAEEPEPEVGEPPEEKENAMPDTTELSEVAKAAPADKLVSEEATSATTASLGKLGKAVAEKSGAKLGVGGAGNTVEDMVKEMMRPMLREWLDDNLPGIVERLVRREIQNLVDRSQDDD